MDDLASGRQVDVPQQVKLSAAQGAPEIGRYGESVVYHHLLKHRFHLPGFSTVQTVWTNEREEMGQPYDLVVKLVDANSQFRDVFVEVKATMTDQKNVFEITGREVEFAYKHWHNYHLYRVYNVNNPDRIRISRIVNLAEKIDKALVKLCMVV